MTRTIRDFLAALPPLRWNGRRGASLETLADRVAYGGRKGRRAARRILRREYPRMVSS